MVDTMTTPHNGAVRTLPTEVHLSKQDGARVPSPGTQRALKAQTGKAWDDLVSPDADSADRFQTLIWIKLRRDIPDLHWSECDGVECVVDDAVPTVDPTKLAVSTTSPSSADSGG